MATPKIEKAQARILKRKVQELKALQLSEGGMSPRKTVEYAAHRMYIKSTIIKSINEEQLAWIWS